MSSLFTSDSGRYWYQSSRLHFDAQLRAGELKKGGGWLFFYQLKMGVGRINCLKGISWESVIMILG